MRNWSRFHLLKVLAKQKNASLKMYFKVNIEFIKEPYSL